MEIPVIIDTDPGMDDAIALFLAFSTDKLDIRAITTVGGNIPLEKTSRNALDLVGYSGKEIRVSKGAAKPLLRALETAQWIHGENGLGPVVLDENKEEFYNMPAWDTIYKESMTLKGKLQLITLGPMTNIARTLIKYPDIVDKIQRITLMGGSCLMGNVTPSAEFNIYVDAEAADIVFRSGIPITMVGLDATGKALVSEKEIEEIISVDTRITELIKRLLISNLEFRKKHLGVNNAMIHDALAVGAVIEPSIIHKEKYHVAIETKDQHTYGRTVVDLNKATNNPPNVEVALDVNRESFVQMLKGMMKAYLK